MASSKKKDRAAAEVDIIKGEAIQSQILRALEGLLSQGRIGDDAIFFKLLAKGLGSKPNKSFLKVYRDCLGEKDETAEVVFADPFAVPIQSGQVCDWAVKPLADSELRDTESIKYKEDIEEYFEREVLPFAPDAWMVREEDKIGYEIPFTKFFYEYKPLRDLTEIMGDLLALEQETEDLLDEIKEDF